MLVKSPLEAYKWWNITKDSSNCEEIPKCISPQEASIIWKKLCPVFNFLAPIHLSTQQYWNQIVKIISPFAKNSNEIPNPITSFPGFINFLYKVRYFISPTNVNQCIQLMLVYNNNNFEKFFLYNMPFYVNEPILYFRSVLEVTDKNHPIWVQFSSHHSICDAFISLHLTFLQPLSSPENSNKWKHHLILGETLYRLITYTIRTNPNSITNSNKFCDSLLRLIPSSPSFVRVTSTRWLLSLTKQTLKKNEKNVLKERIQQFLAILGKLSDIYFYSIIFIKNNLISITRGAKLVNSISVNSIQNIDLILSFVEQIGPMTPITHLAKGCLSSKLWHRAAFSAMIEIIAKYGEKKDIKEWLTVFIRRVLIFVSLSFISCKYNARSLLIVESISRLATVGIKWIKKHVLEVAFTLLLNKNVPFYFSSFFFANSSKKFACDEETLNEVEAFQHCQASLDLKNFPFDGKKSTFVVPPKIENGRNKNLIHSSLSVNGANCPQNLNSSIHSVQRNHLLQLQPRKQSQIQQKKSSLKTEKKEQPQKKAPKKKATPVIKKPKPLLKHNQHFKQ